MFRCLILTTEHSLLFISHEQLKQAIIEKESNVNTLRKQVTASCKQNSAISSTNTQTCQQLEISIQEGSFMLKKIRLERIALRDDISSKALKIVRITCDIEFLMIITEIFQDRIDVESKKQQLEALEQKIEHVEQVVKALRRVIQKAQPIAHQTNQQAFEQTNSRFSELFSQLVPTKRASLVQCVEQQMEQGVEFCVTNAGCEQQNLLSLLSGGQKTLLCMAFIFSVATVRFVVMCKPNIANPHKQITNLHYG